MITYCNNGSNSFEDIVDIIAKVCYSKVKEGNYVKILGLVWLSNFMLNV